MDRDEDDLNDGTNDDQNDNQGQEPDPRDDEIAALKAKLAELEGAKKEPPKEDKKPRYTKAQLDKFVEEGAITQEVAARIWDEQRADDIAERVRKQTKAERAAANIQKEIDTYKRLVPNVLREGTQERKAVAAEFRRLVDEQGEPEDGPAGIKTELMAIRTVLGPVSAIEKKGKRVADTHQDGGSGPGGGSDSNDGDPKTTPPKNITARQKDYYDQLIKTGVYKDWQEVRDELKFAKPSRNKAH